MAKKDEIKQKYDEFGNVILQDTAALADAQRKAYADYEAEAAAAEQERQQQSAQNIKTVADYLNQGYDAQQAMLLAAQNHTRQAEAEAAQQVKADNQAAKYAGLTELAASIANLVGVGEGHAVSQQYRQYSQDWMRKADIDARTHRARIDNLRERQRAIQQNLNQLKVNNNLTIAQMQAEADRQANAERLRRAEAKAKNEITIAGLESQGRRDAAQASLQGAEKQAHLDLQKRGQDISAGQHRDSMEQTYQLYGFTKNDKGEWEAPEGYVPRGQGGKGGGSGWGKEGDRDYFIEGEKRIPLYWTSNERKNFIRNAVDVLRNVPAFRDEYDEAKGDEKDGIVIRYALMNPGLRNDLYSYTHEKPGSAQGSQYNNALDAFMHE